MANLCSVLESFTTNDEIDNFVEADTTTELKGFVDAIEGSRTVGKFTQKILYKIVVNNGQGRRVRVLFWDALAAKYSPLISNRKVISIVRCRPALANQNYANPAENIAPMELSIMQYTQITLEDAFNDQVSIEDVPDVEIENIGLSEGVISVTGYIKLAFQLITAGGSSFGSGAIMDGEYKLRVQIADFLPNDNRIVGQQVKLRGEVKEDRNGNIYLQMRNSNDIQELDESVSTSVLKQGVKTPKRSSPSHLGGESKRSRGDIAE